MKEHITIQLTNDVIKRGLIINSKTQGIGAKLVSLALHKNDIMHSHITWNNVDGEVFISNKLYVITAYNTHADKVDLDMFEPTWGNKFRPMVITLEFIEIK